MQRSVAWSIGLLPGRFSVSVTISNLFVSFIDSLILKNKVNYP